jgi:flagellar assembly factor FliW
MAAESHSTAIGPGLASAMKQETAMAHAIMSPVIRQTAGPTMLVQTLFAGTIELGEDQIVSVVEPLLGFEHLERFILFQTQEGPFLWLQALDDPSVTLCLTQPFLLGLDPDYPIGPSDLSEIGEETLAGLSVYTVVILDKDSQKIRTNLRAPILVGRKSNRAKQVVFDHPSLPLQFFLKDLPKR